MTELHVRLLVHDADAALDFYARALGAKTVERFHDPDADKVVHAAFAFDGVTVALADEDRRHGNVAPTTLGGAPVIMNLTVDDADAWAQRMVDAGAEVLIPVEDRFYGKREGRLRDPFGHLWILSQPLEALSEEEIRARMRGS